MDVLETVLGHSFSLNFTILGLMEPECQTRIFFKKKDERSADSYSKSTNHLPIYL